DLERDRRELLSVLVPVVTDQLVDVDALLLRVVRGVEVRRRVMVVQTVLVEARAAAARRRLAGDRIAGQVGQRELGREVGRDRPAGEVLAGEDDEIGIASGRDGGVDDRERGGGGLRSGGDGRGGYKGSKECESAHALLTGAHAEFVG